MENKKVLILSVPSWNKKSGSDTFSSLMEGYGADNVANIYIREDLPDSKVCNNYFRISENAVIKSIFKRNIKTGKQVFAECVVDDNIQNRTKTKERYRKYSKKRNIFFLLLREIFWKIGKWRSKELDDFIDDFSPDVVFFSMEGYIHLDRIARYVIKKTGAKGIGYFWDDNFTYKKSKRASFRFYRFFQRRELKKCVKLCTDFFAISPKTKKEADEVFNINCMLLTKPIESSGEFSDYKISSPIKMIYTGKLIIGRFDTIKIIGNALDEINADKTRIILDVYTTTELTSEEKNSLSSYVNVLGAIPQDEVFLKQKQADILLFAEAISGKSALTARLSFSTKLTDYFRSGKCILAVGNADTAPIEYLKQEDAAIVALDYEGIINAINTILKNEKVVLEYAKKAFRCGQNNHNKEKIQKLLFKTINS